MRNFSRSASVSLMFVSLLVVFIVSSGFASALYAAQPGTLKWKVKLTSQGSSNGALTTDPAIGPDGNVYVLSRTPREIFSIAPDGSVNWRKQDMNTNPTLSRDGTIHTQRLSQQKQVALSQDGSVKQEFSAAKTGLNLMLTPTGQELEYITGRDTLLRLDRSNQSELWRSSLFDRSANAGAITRDGASYVSSQGSVVAVDTAGQNKWTYNFTGVSKHTPAIAEDGTMYTVVIYGSGFTSDNGYLTAFNPDGSIKWEFKTNDGYTNLNDATFREHSNPVIGPNGVIYVGSDDGTLYAVNPDGTQKWAFNASSPVKSSPAVAEDGTVYVGSEDGTVYAVNPDGTEKWSFQTNGRIHSEMNIGNDGTVYFTSWDGHIYAINGEGGGVAEDSPWPIDNHDQRKTASKNVSLCNLKPKVKLFPPIVNPHFGRTLVFITGFKESDNRPSDIDASSVSLAGAQPQKWITVPHFLLLKYKNKDLEIGETSPGKFFFKSAALPLEGSLKSSGCFETEKEVLVWP